MFHVALCKGNYDVGKKEKCREESIDRAVGLSKPRSTSYGWRPRHKELNANNYKEMSMSTTY